MSVRILTGDARDQLRQIADASVHCVVTSPPYFGLRDYGCEGQIGLEATPDAYVAELVAIFREVRRAMRGDGTLWLNIGDSYANTGNKGQDFSASKVGYGGAGRGKLGGQPIKAIPVGCKPKDLLGIPWMLAFALRADGWYLRQDIIWSKPNPMPESVTDRCTKAHEYLFLLSKSARYHYDAEAIQEACSETSHGSPNINPGKKNAAVRGDVGSLGKWPSGRPGGRRPDQFDDLISGASRSGIGEGLAQRNKRSVWEVTTLPFSQAHFATFPPALVEPCILAGCPVGGTVLDPFFGAGTTGLVADRLGRDCIGIELNPAYAAMAKRRIEDDAPLFADISTGEELWGDGGETLPEPAIINGLGGDRTYLLKLSIPAQDTGGNPRKRQKILGRPIT